MAKIKGQHILVDQSTIYVDSSGQLSQTPGTDGGDSPSGSGGEFTEVEYFITSASGLVSGNKYVYLKKSPTDKSAVRVTIIGGSAQLNSKLIPASDFDLLGKKLTWDGLGMETALVSADIEFLVEYSVQLSNPEAGLELAVDTSLFNGKLNPATDTNVQLALTSLATHTHSSADIVSPSFLAIHFNKYLCPCVNSNILYEYYLII